jgi:uncharacterized membrane protein
MSASSLATIVIVPFFGALLWVTPAITRPTVQFGVRIPGDRAGAPVIRRERRAYYWRTAAIGLCFTITAVLVQGHASWWLGRIILLLELAADLGCYQIARKNIAAVKNAEDWFAGLRQMVATDTSWRTDPPRFPASWLLPALTVIAVTVIVGAVRYPDLPARLMVGFGGSSAGHQAPKSVVSVFALAVGQLYVTALWTGLMLIVYRSRPDIESADAASSTRRYRMYLAALTRAVLTLIALVNLTLLLAALRTWHVYRLTGIASALPLLPFTAGLIIIAIVAVRTGQGGSRLSAGTAGTSGHASKALPRIGQARLSLVSPGPARNARLSRIGVGGGPSSGSERASRLPGESPGQSPQARTDRDDDRFWKAGLIYVNRDDPAIMVGNRFGVGWTFNFANRTAWLVLAGIVAAPAGLAAIMAAAGL